MRKVSMILALALCLSLVPVAVSAPEVTFSFNKTEYDIGEDIVVTITGITAQMQADGVRAYLYKVGTTDSRDYRSHTEITANKSVYTFFWSKESAMHEIRLVRPDWTILTTSQPFPVGLAAVEGNISLDKTAYTALEEITISVSDITEQMADAKAAVCIYVIGAKHEDRGVHGFWTSVPAGSSTQKLSAPNKNGEYEMRLYSNGNALNDETFVLSVPFTVSGAVTGSSWAEDTLVRAGQLGLIPDVLKGQDLSKPITRGEFAAVCVKVFESLTQKPAVPKVPNPFTDTADTEILKALNHNLMVGTSATEFTPHMLLNRETLAAALMKVIAASHNFMYGFFDETYTRPAPFADDQHISDWAKNSVYFMNANGLIAGMGNNMFAPKATTTAEEAAGYATASREMAIIIALRIVDKYANP